MQPQIRGIENRGGRIRFGYFYTVTKETTCAAGTSTRTSPDGSNGARPPVHRQRGGPRALIESLRTIRVRATLSITCSEEKLVTAYIVPQEGYFSLNHDALATAANDADA